MDNIDEKPVSARECAPLVGTSVSSLYRMARLSLVPHLKTGVHGRAVRFIPREVLAVLRRPSTAEQNRGAA